MRPCLVVLLLTACATRPVVPLAPEEPPPPRADGRLPETARPVSYQLDLAVDPSKPTFTGAARIELELSEATRHLVLHGRDLAIARATLVLAGEKVPATATARKGAGALAAEELVLTFARRVGPGRARLDIAWEAAFSQELVGLYSVVEEGRAYAFTQFESTHARRAFPCFDEPALRAPIELALTVPPGAVAVANAPEIYRLEEAGGTTVRFARTPPLPTYLVAFAVGPFEVRKGRTSPVPIRLVAPAGRARFGGFVLDASAALLAELADTLGIAYPFAKLDVLAVPGARFGGMENPGLIAARDDAILLDEATAAPGARRWATALMAHELAHMWFGDYVTVRWWDEVWLNEGFATWMEHKALDRLQPSIRARLQELADRQGVMDLDAQRSALPVRSKVGSTGDAESAFSAIAYDKGAAVLGMLEAWLGEEAFREELRGWLKAHAFGVSTSEELIEALDHVAGKPVRQIAATFLDQPGVPLVTARVACEPSGRARVALSQSPWRPIGGPAVEREWLVPACVEAPGLAEPVCALVGKEPAEVVLPTSRCPAWVWPNAREAGYFRSLVPSEMLRALVQSVADLDEVRRLGLLGNLWAAARAGQASPALVLDTVQALDGDGSRLVIGQIAGTLEELSDALVETAARPAFRTWVASRFAERKRALGWESIPGETEEAGLARDTVLRLLGELADDPVTLSQAERYAGEWLEDSSRVPEEIAVMALPLASRRAGPGRAGELVQALGRARTPQERAALIRALGKPTSPAALRAGLEAALMPGVKPAETLRVLYAAARADWTSTFAWMQERLELLTAKLPGGMMSQAMWTVGYACSAADVAAAREFFSPRAAGIEGAVKPLEDALESAETCATLRDARAAEVTRYLGTAR